MIYVDLIFAVNFLTDGALLLATAWTRRLVVRIWRLALAACIGSLYVLLMLVPEVTGLFTFAVKFLVSVLMIGIAFGFGKWQVMLRNLAAFYLVAFAVGGGIYGLYYYFMPSRSVLDAIMNGVFDWPASYWLIGLCFILLVWLYLYVFRGAKRKQEAAAHTAPVEVQVEDYRLCCIGLVDTGNQLYDPLTKTPVMIVEAALWKDVLPEVWLKRIRSCNADQIVAAMGEEDFIWQDRLRIVPYRGVNSSTQFMLAIKPDTVRLQYEGRQLETGRVLIGFDGGALSSDGSYQAIIHPMLLQE